HSRKAMQTAYATLAARDAISATSGVAAQLSQSQLGDLAEGVMDIGEDERFQLPMAASGINSATLSDEILCAVERLLDVMERPL
ncbi:hypothetical protein MJN85_32405, partial [Salmonella enterica subsp. enterica serovar Anatum]|nr:hypothetical protein [Salmonella enterica subsp. enterica serovar Anatum]